MSFYYVIIDRDGGEVTVSEDYDSYEEADKAAEFWTDDWRYGSHEVVEES